ncbi:hypothetical protein [Aurantimonas sp. VKM B-3413]|uniref:hypothetical protein n=1 Tax=Aurantimonas sp. VKM B-3413 TaxID=2779401 RepID=UPI001E3193A8|nr:hypothetical protein [Aurantimonas sp. VKM B-3413]MCB8836319.1 hypothetical protein [Aurantimonas sp. VKM B-3413]
MFGEMIAALGRPDVALGIVAALDDADLVKRLAAASDAAGRAPADTVRATVHGFVETASDDDWMQLMGIMNRAGDPGLAAIRAILARKLPAIEETAS